MQSVKILLKKMILISFVLFGIVIISYSQNNHSSVQSNGPVQLKYNFPQGKDVKYLSSNKVVQSMDFDGQSIDVNVNTILGCTVTLTGTAGENLKLSVRVDTMAQSVDSPNGATGGAITEPIGKSFTMILSPSGVETDVSEAENLIYNSMASGQGNVRSSFNDFFPDLPVGPIQPGYTWTTSDTLKDANTSSVMVIKTENTFTGIEKVNGTDCAKITSVLNGTRDMTTQSQGMDIHISGPYTGTAELYFATAEGYFLKHLVNTKLTGLIEISGAENMSLPVIMDIASVNKVIE